MTKKAVSMVAEWEMRLAALKVERKVERMAVPLVARSAVE